MRRGRYAPPATLNLGLSAWRCALRKGKVWRLARHNHQERTNVHSYTNPLTLCSFPLGKARMGLSSGNSVGVALSRRRYRSRNISGTAANITIINNKQGDTKTQKAVVTAVGFAWVCLSVTPVGKRVFLFVVATIPTVMHGMTTAVTTVKKAPLGRSKSPPLAVQKQQLVDDPPNSPKRRELIESPSLALPNGREFIESPSLALPKGREFTLAAFVEVVSAFLPLDEGSAGVSLGWLVTYVTWSRINCYGLTCLMSRALVSNVTSRRGCLRGCRDALA